ncbi:MAG: diguanylate cyclase [Desulfohalobiaceae bacterium]|nr:diguanylate cyclase [Desulfohalobiaceae bacterium]
MTDPCLKVLFAEDEKIQAVWLQSLLENYGYSVEWVTNGLQALDRLAKDRFSIVMTDLMMPEMNGIELCQAIRKLQYSHYIYIIIVTGKEGKEELISGIYAGADDFINKPVDEKELFARLKTARRILEMEQTLVDQYKEISLLSVTDPLTKTYNRRFFTEQLQSEMARCVRYSHDLTLILCDIDHFKAVNDTYGHQMGDLVLQEFADCLNRGIRQEVDYVARYGGEEFIVILPETGCEDALTCSERLRQEVSKLSFLSESGPFGITASFGTVTVKGRAGRDYPDVDILLKATDDNLYQAKKQGRNCCVCSKI